MKCVEYEDKCILKIILVNKQENDKFKPVNIDHIHVTERVLMHPELRPPKEMPHGNVGTSTKVFLDIIRSCQLPPRTIRRLGLEFPKNRSRKRYSNVPFDYGTVIKKGASFENKAFTGSGMELSSTYLHRKPRVEANDRSTEKQYEDQEDSSSEDDDRGEEWDRHAADTNDVSSQERTKERLFEEEMEVVWEKGGSGLVFYTDAQYWDEKEGGFDGKTADNFDLDMRVYYHKGGGDKDSRDLLDIRREAMLRHGRDASELTCKKRCSLWASNSKDKEDFMRPSTSSFETKNAANHSFHTTKLSKTQQKKMRKALKAIKDDEFEDRFYGKARQIMKKKGWEQGKPLGNPRQEGLIYPIESEGQIPGERRGFGYHGEVLPREKATKPKFSNEYEIDPSRHEERTITTIYDNPVETDPLESLGRSDPPSKLVHKNWFL
ncbi:G patch domain-containing protein 3-like isoform X2 [Artemia franciscana]